MHACSGSKGEERVRKKLGERRGKREGVEEVERRDPRERDACQHQKGCS